MGFTGLFNVGYPNDWMRQWIEDHPPPESADGVGSLYAVRP